MIKGKPKTLMNYRSTKLEILPSGKIDSFEIWADDHVPDNPPELMCDCCLEMSGELWAYRHYGFCIRFLNGGGRLEFKESQWAFCKECMAQYFPGKDHISLAQRVHSLNPHIHFLILVDMYAVLGNCIYGDAIAWKSGESFRENVASGV
jgi:hypothetical protein